jgi:hypothetical protein
LGCFDKSTSKIKVNVGKFGFMELALCKNCKIFFDNLNKYETNSKSIDKSFRGANQQVTVAKGKEYSSW